MAVALPLSVKVPTATGCVEIRDGGRAETVRCRQGLGSTPGQPRLRVLFFFFFFFFIKNRKNDGGQGWSQPECSHGAQHSIKTAVGGKKERHN